MQIGSSLWPIADGGGGGYGGGYGGVCGVDGGLCDGGVSGAGGAVQLISCPASRALNCSTLKDWISACALSPRMVAAPSRVSAPAAHAETLVNRHPEFERVAHFAEFCFVSHLTTMLVKASLWLSQPRGRKCRKEREEGCERKAARGWKLHNMWRSKRVRRSG